MSAHGPSTRARKIVPERPSTVNPQELRRGDGPAQPVGTWNTRVPQFRRRSGVWLDLAGTYSVASQTEVRAGSITAQE